MFKRLFKWPSGAAQVSPESLSWFAPYAHLAPLELEMAAELAERVWLKPGLVNHEFAVDRRFFLEQGRLQVQTLTGELVTLEAGSARSAYPLPLRSAVAGLSALGSCSLVGIPESLEGVPQTPVSGALQRPSLDPGEMVALEGLRSYFRAGECELPSLPDLALKIGKAIDDQDNGNDQIADLIQFDPGLAARVISVVNSPAFGGVSRIESIHQATARLGREKVRSLVYSCLVKSLFRINSELLQRRMSALWQHSVHVAALSYVLGRETPGIDPDRALLSGLVHDIGAVAVIGAVRRFPELVRREEVLDYAIDSLRIEAGTQTLTQWGLLDEFGAVVRHAEHWYWPGSAIADYPDVVILAQLHAFIGSARQRTLPSLDTVPAYAKLANGELTPRQSLAMLEAAESDIAQIRALIGGG